MAYARVHTHTHTRTVGPLAHFMTCSPCAAAHTFRPAKRLRTSRLAPRPREQHCSVGVHAWGFSQRNDDDVTFDGEEDWEDYVSTASTHATAMLPAMHPSAMCRTRCSLCVCAMHCIFFSPIDIKTRTPACPLSAQPASPSPHPTHAPHPHPHRAHASSPALSPSSSRP